MLKRIKRMWDLSRKDPESLENLTQEQIDNLPDEGDGKAFFFGEGTHEEWEELRKEDEGMSSWYERLKNL